MCKSSSSLQSSLRHWACINQKVEGKQEAWRPTKERFGAPWVSKGFWSSQASQTGSRSHTRLWVQRPSRPTALDGVCWRKACGPAGSPQLCLPLQTETANCTHERNTVSNDNISWIVWRVSLLWFAMTSTWMWILGYSNFRRFPDFCRCSQVKQLR